MIRASKQPRIFFTVLIFIVASIFKRILQPFLFTYSLISAINKGKTELNNWMWDMNKSIDMNGNTLGKYFWNDLFLNKNVKTYSFGKPKETMSSVVGKNDKFYLNSLIGFGLFLRDRLNEIEKDHTSLAIDNNV